MTEPLTLELPTVASVALWLGAAMLGVIAALAGAIAWFLRREIKNNDATHRDLRKSIDKLLEGDVGWVQLLMNRLGQAPRGDG